MIVGKYGQCCDFNGNNCLKLKSPITFANQEFTFCAWVYRISDFFRVYSARTTTGGAGLFISVENNNIVFDDGTRFSPQISFPERKWTHICLTRTSKEKKIYINGELVLLTNTVGNMEGISTTAFIGVSSENDKITGYTQGRLNDYRIYDHCLSDAEVKEISKGLVLHYTMDKVYKENKVYDSSGFGNDGIPTDLEYSIDRKKGLTSTKYNGSTSRILTQKGSFSWFNFDECTISCWMKPTSSPSGYTGGVGVSYDGEASEKTLCLNNHGGKLCVESTRDYNWITYSSDYILPINEWSHCVITINKDNIIKFYVNGELIKTDTLNFGSITYSNANALFQVGCDLAGGDEYYQGYYDDVRFYTTSLSADDILQLYKETQKIDNKGNLYCSELNEVERRVEYLESTGTQYIDTGIKSEQKDIIFEMEVQFTQTSSNRQLFGGNYGYWFGIDETGQYHYSNSGKLVQYNSNSFDHIIYKGNHTEKKKEMYINNSYYQTNYNDFQNYAIYLFNLGGDLQYKTFCRVKYCKIWKERSPSPRFLTNNIYRRRTYRRSLSI